MDHVQLARFVFFAILNAPLNYLWQHFLERTFPGYPRPSRSRGKYRQDLEKGRDIGKGAPRGRDLARPQASKPKLNLRNTFIKWFIDSIFLGAIFNTVMFLVLMGAMKGESFKVIQSNLETVRFVGLPLGGV